MSVNKRGHEGYVNANRQNVLSMTKVICWRSLITHARFLFLSKKVTVFLKKNITYIWINSVVAMYARNIKLSKTNIAIYLHKSIYMSSASPASNSMVEENSII